MSQGDDMDAPIRIECVDCHFATVVRPDDGDSATEVIVRHGRETGHRLTPTQLDDDGGT